MITIKFTEIQIRLLARIRYLIHNGELTERGFARISGISQSHIHKVLKGTRTLSAARFDLLLKAVDCSVLDLVEEDELRSHLACAVRPKEACTELPLHPAALGPGARWPWDGAGQELYPVPCSLLSGEHRLMLVRLKDDPSMLQTLGPCNLGVLEMSNHATAQVGSLYAVDRAGDTVLRSVRRGAACLYLVSDENWNDPLHWEIVPMLDRLGLPVIRGRVVWLSEEKWKKPPRRELGHVFADATSSYVSRT